MIPNPEHMKISKGEFVYSDATVFSAEALKYKKFLPKTDGAGGGRVVYEQVQREGYRLTVDEKGIKVEAADDESFFWATMSLKYMLLTSSALPFVEIEDKPRFAYRGFMLDTARHFFGVDFIKKVIDALALFKFNRLHLHLSDDQGFRFGSEKFEKLVEVGSKREGTRGDKIEHGGYYTKSELIELVKYAAERHIEIIPEVDIPAHTGAVLASYPNLSCAGKAKKVDEFFGILGHTLCAGKEETYKFLFELFDEIIEVFPSEYIHIGGDESDLSVWSRCPDCQKTKNEYNLKSNTELKELMLRRVECHLKDRGRKVICWNDAVKCVSDEAVCQFWQGKLKETLAFADKGGKVIVSKFSPYYIDYPHGMHSLKAVYEFNPILDGLSSDGVKNVIGVEAPLWTEFVDSESKAFRQMFPRLLALAERAWSQNPNYDRFISEIGVALNALSKCGYEYTPIEKANPKKIEGVLETVKFGLNLLDKTTLPSLIRAAKAKNKK